MGVAADSGRAGISSSELGTGPRRRVLPGSGGSHRIRTRPRHLEFRPRHRLQGRSAGRGHRGVDGPGPRRPKLVAVVSSGAGRRLLRVRRPAANTVARFRRRAGWRNSSTSSSAFSTTAASWCHDDRARDDGGDVRRSGHRTGTVCGDADLDREGRRGRGGRGSGARHRAALPGAHRTAAAQLHRRGGGRRAGPVRPSRALGHRSAASCGSTAPP